VCFVCGYNQQLQPRQTMVEGLAAAKAAGLSPAQVQAALAFKSRSPRHRWLGGGDGHRTSLEYQRLAGLTQSGRTFVTIWNDVKSPEAVVVSTERRTG